MNSLTVTSPAFGEGGSIPRRYTGRGEDVSPALELHGLAPGAVSIAVTLDDASHPFIPNYNHWAIWNLPVRSLIPEAIPRGALVETLGGAVQGMAYGRHRYRGPKPPLDAEHTYVFTLYVLDCRLDLSPRCHKRALLAAMEGHVLQKSTITGKFRSRG